jgi:sugar/nucleoside kinase (ribokinase family)
LDKKPRKKTLKKAGERSQAAAALSTQAAGARTAMPTNDEVDVFLAGNARD